MAVRKGKDRFMEVPMPAVNLRFMRSEVAPPHEAACATALAGTPRDAFAYKNRLCGIRDVRQGRRPTNPAQTCIDGVASCGVASDHPVTRKALPSPNHFI